MLAAYSLGLYTVKALKEVTGRHLQLRSCIEFMETVTVQSPVKFAGSDAMLEVSLAGELAS